MWGTASEQRDAFVSVALRQHAEWRLMFTHRNDHGSPGGVQTRPEGGEPDRGGCLGYGALGTGLGAVAEGVRLE